MRDQYQQSDHIPEERDTPEAIDLEAVEVDLNVDRGGDAGLERRIAARHQECRIPGDPGAALHVFDQKLGGNSGNPAVEEDRDPPDEEPDAGAEPQDLQDHEMRDRKEGSDEDPHQPI